MKQFFRQVKQWASMNPEIDCILLVGSYARNTAKTDSDIDLVIISNHKNELVQDCAIFAFFGPIRHKQIEYYGACTSWRIFYENGLEAEFGLVDRSWIQMPLDEGTAHVLQDGFQVLYDKYDYMKQIKST